MALSQAVFYDRIRSSRTVPNTIHSNATRNYLDYMDAKGPLLSSDVLSWISHSPECFKYRVDTINWVQEQLKNPVTAVSGATIGAIMSLTMWEVCGSVDRSLPMSLTRGTAHDPQAVSHYTRDLTNGHCHLGR